MCCHHTEPTNHLCAWPVLLARDNKPYINSTMAVTTVIMALISENWLRCILIDKLAKIPLIQNIPSVSRVIQIRNDTAKLVITAKFNTHQNIVLLVAFILSDVWSVLTLQHQQTFKNVPNLTTETEGTPWKDIQL
jgi:hypothetical protein